MGGTADQTAHTWIQTQGLPRRPQVCRFPGQARLVRRAPIPFPLCHVPPRFSSTHRGASRRLQDSASQRGPQCFVSWIKGLAAVAAGDAIPAISSCHGTRLPEGSLTAPDRWVLAFLLAWSRAPGSISNALGFARQSEIWARGFRHVRRKSSTARMRSHRQPRCISRESSPGHIDGNDVLYH